jgi:hypothetical protein
MTFDRGPVSNHFGVILGILNAHFFILISSDIIPCNPKNQLIRLYVLMKQSKH